MGEKERHQLNFVYNSVPKPYYERWKAEANELFSLMVALQHRPASDPETDVLGARGAFAHLPRPA